MKITKNTYTIANITVLVLSVLCTVSCKSILFSQAISIQNESNTARVSSESEAASNVVKDFWQFSLEGNKDKIREQIREVPEQFLIGCSNDLTKNQNVVYDISSSEENFPKAELNKSLNISRKDEYFLLGYFSEQINQGKYKLFFVREEKIYGNEAILTIGWGRENDASATIQEIFLLYKENEKWKIFMVTNSAQAHRYNKYFAQKMKC